MGCVNSAPQTSEEKTSSKSQPSQQSVAQRRQSEPESLNSVNKHMDLKRRTEQKTTEVKLNSYKMKYAYVCQQGHYPDKPGYICQDQCTVIEKFEDNPDQCFMGVFDGHGAVGAGDVVAKKTRELIPKTFLELRASGKYQKFGPPGEPLPDVGKSAYEHAFDVVSKKVVRDLRERSNMAGSTAITVFFSGTAIHVANVGDSRAILGRSGNRVLALSADQTPFRPDERERILTQNKNAQIMTLAMNRGEVPVSTDYGDENDLFGAAADPPRVFLKGKPYPGSAFTRSIGDAVAKTVGVCADPEILSRKLGPDDKYIVICSDGVFEFLTDEDVLAIVEQNADPYDAANELVNTAFNMWLEQDTRTDDITAIVVHLDMGGDKGRGPAAAVGPPPSLTSKWQVARTVLPSYARRPMRAALLKAVHQAYKQKKLYDKDNAVLDSMGNEQLTGVEIKYDD